MGCCVSRNDEFYEKDEHYEHYSKEESATIVDSEDYALDDPKAIPSLLDEDKFLLLYVPPKDEKTKMKLVKPSKDPYHKKRIMQRISSDGDSDMLLPHFALSHVWKISKPEDQWEKIGQYVDDEHGNPVKSIPMRSEKRNTILALLFDHPDSYWWIDVLCARTDTPLEIMGDIYACCKRCYAMIDGDAGTIPKIRQYMNRIPDQEGYWSKRLKRLRMDDPQYASALDQYKQAVDVLDTFMERDWWKRVWTWQELVLPRKVVFLAETANQVSDINMLDMQLLARLEKNLQTESFRIPGKPLKRTGSIRLMEMNRSREACEAFRAERISFWTLNHLFHAFARSSRKCTNPVDYVYGVLGVLQFNIPRMSDPNQVWQYFLVALDDFIMDIKRRSMIDQRDELFAAIRVNQAKRDFDLQAAECMSDVYKELLDIDMFTVMF